MALDVRPVSHVELLVDRHAELIRVVTDATLLVLLGAQVETVHRVALGVAHHHGHRLDGSGVVHRPEHTAAVANVALIFGVRLEEAALAWVADVSRVDGRVARLDIVVQLALNVLVRRIARVRLVL